MEQQGKIPVSILLIVIFVIGFVLRMLFVNTIRLDYDEGLFLFIGLNYKDGAFIDGIFQNFSIDQPPLAPIFYSILFSFVPLDYAIGRIANVLISSLAILVIHGVTREIWNKKVGLTAAYLVMIDPT